MVLNFVISGILAVPNVYYGVTRGNWVLGWDYVLTGHDYFGDAMDYVLGSDEVTEGAPAPDTGLTVGDIDVLTEQFNAIYEMAIVAIIVVVAVALLVFFTGNKKNNKRRS